MQRGNFDMTVKVNGRAVREYSDRMGQVWIEGRYGSEYTFVIHNFTSQRVLAIPTVDGLSVMDGQAGSEASGGYVIGPYGQYVVRGWRLSDAQAAVFKFGVAHNSYATKMGKGNNLGIIGCMIIAEDVPVYVRPKIPIKPTYESPYTFGDVMRGGEMKGCGEPSYGATRGMGTEMGRPTQDRVRTTTFRRGRVLAELVIRYGDRETLQHAGINMGYTPEVVQPEYSDAFPARTGCPVPDDYPYRHPGGGCY